MTQDLGGDLDATSGQATKDRRQELGRQVFFALHAIMRNARLHDENNDAFTPVVQQLRDALRELIAADGAFSLKVAGDGLYVNRQIVRIEAAAAPLAAFVRSELAARGIHGIAASVAPELLELGALVRVFTAAAAKRPGERGDPARPLSALSLLITAGAEAGLKEANDRTRLVDAYSHAVLFVGRYVELLRGGSQGIPIWAASRVVQNMVDLQRDAPLRFLQLARTKGGGVAYWGYHAANVAVLAIAFGARLGFDKKRRHDLGMSALFHDIGMIALPEDLLYKEADLDDRDRLAVAASPLFTARAILRDREVHPAALERARAAYECHVDPAKQPVGAGGRVLAVCEAYDALTTARPWRTSLSRREALLALEVDLTHKLDQKLLAHFVEATRALG